MTHHRPHWALATVVALAVLLPGPTVLAAGVSVDDASWAETNEATQKYMDGKRAFDQGKLEEALARFRDSYDTVASPNSHLMIAQVLIELERYVDAYQELGQVIEEAGAAKKKSKYATTAATAQALRESLEQKIGFIQVDPPARTTVGGKPLPHESWGSPMPTMAGEVEIEIALEDGTKRTETVTVRAGEVSRVSLRSEPETKPPPTPSKKCPKPERVVAKTGTIKQTTVGYVALGTGGVGLVAFTVFGILDNEKYRGLEDECTNGVCPAGLQDDAEQGRTYQALANVGLGVGIVGIGAGALLLLTAPRNRSKTSRRHIELGPRGVSVKGVF